VPQRQVGGIGCPERLLPGWTRRRSATSSAIRTDTPRRAPPRPLRKQPLWSADAANLALWHSSVVQMSASPRVIRPRAWPDWSLRSARSTARCLSGVPGAGREPDATRESARARRRAVTMIIRMRNHNRKVPQRKWRAHGSGAPPSGRSEWDPARAASPLPLAFRGALCNSHSPRFALPVGLDFFPLGLPTGTCVAKPRVVVEVTSGIGKRDLE